MRKVSYLSLLICFLLFIIIAFGCKPNPNYQHQKFMENMDLIDAKLAKWDSAWKIRPEAVREKQQEFKKEYEPLKGKMDETTNNTLRMLNNRVDKYITMTFGKPAAPGTSNTTGTMQNKNKLGTTTNTGTMGSTTTGGMTNTTGSTTNTMGGTTTGTMGSTTNTMGNTTTGTMGSTTNTMGNTTTGTMGSTNNTMGSSNKLGGTTSTMGNTTMNPTPQSSGKMGGK